MSGRTLEAVIDAVRSREKTLRVYAPDDDPAVGELREYLASQNVRIDHVVDDPPRAEVLEGETVIGAVEAGGLRALTTGGSGEAATSLLEHLDGATFTSYDRDQMLYASREIEDRAWRVGQGTLYAGFQHREAFEDQLDAYEELGNLSGLTVHVYVPEAPDVDEPFTVHVDGMDAIDDKWFVIFDGGGQDDQKSALLAVEHSPGEFYGVWTYDPSIVEDALAVLDE